MINKAILFLLDRLSFLFRQPDVNYQQLRAIVEIKLMMDNRRQRFRLGGNDSSKETSNGFVWQIVILFLVSSLISLLILFVPSVTLVYTLISAYTMLMITMILITDFSQVILDNSDGIIILPRPVSNKTYYLAKLTHVFSYMLQIGLALSLPAVILTFFKYGILAGITFFTAAFLLIILAVFFTNLMYLLLIKFASEDALQNIINYVQIAVTIVVMVGYQLVARIFGNDFFQSPEAIEPTFLHLLLPPFWLGYAMNALMTAKFTTIAATSSLLLIFTPIVTTYSLSSGLLKGFGTKLGRIDSSTKVEQADFDHRKIGLVELLSKWVLKTPVEKSSFEFVWKMTSRDRKFKLRAYPSLAYLLVYIPVIFGSNLRNSSFSDVITELQNSPGIMLTLIYFTTVMINVVRTNVVFYDEPKAAWIYGATPIKHPGELLSGQFWAIFFKFQFTAVVIVSTLVIAIWGITSVDDILFGLFLMMALQLLISLGFKSKLPFSFKFESGKNANFIQVIGYMFALTFMGGVHWVLMKVPFVVMVSVPLAAALVWFLSKELRKVPWSKIEY